MKSNALAMRNLKETWRDPLSLGLTVLLPAALLVIFQAFGRFDDIFKPAALTPGIALFGFVMVMFSAALLLAKDRESALFARLLTAPLRPAEFIAGYALPYLPVAIVQTAVLFAIGFALGMEIVGSVWLVILVLLITAVLFVALGMILGAAFSVKQVPILYAVILLLTIFGGAWMNLEAIGGGFQTFGEIFPFAHALDATRDVIIDGSGLGAIATDLYWVLGYTVAMVAIALVVFQRRMQE